MELRSSSDKKDFISQYLTLHFNTLHIYIRDLARLDVATQLFNITEFY